MKKIIQNYSVSLKPIELTFSDIEKICNIFSEENILYRLKTETIEFENFQELQNHSEDIISNLEIYSSEPYISIELKNTHLQDCILLKTDLYQEVYWKK